MIMAHDDEVLAAASPAYAAALPGGRCLAICRQCGSPVPLRGLSAMAMPFTDSDARDLWTAQHIQATGHEVAKVDGWPDADRAYRDVFGWPAGGIE